MPILTRDPWLVQYFQNVTCPEDVVVPTDDLDAWQSNPTHRWVYNKLEVALSQDLEAAPHGVIPPNFPVFSKPIMNLRGMGINSRSIESLSEYKASLTPGNFWCTLLVGPHVSSDVAFVDGQPRWWRHTLGYPAGEGTFDYWHIKSEPMPDIEKWCADWAYQHLTGYTGMANFETIGCRIIEVHLRFADQWTDLYGEGWLDAVVRLYAAGIWDYQDNARKEGFSIVLMGSHGQNYCPPPPTLVSSIAAMDGIVSVQITFDESETLQYHAMPPGGFRVAVINALTLDAGDAARRRLYQNMIIPENRSLTA